MVYKVNLSCVDSIRASGQDLVWQSGGRQCKWVVDARNTNIWDPIAEQALLSNEHCTFARLHFWLEVLTLSGRTWADVSVSWSAHMVAGWSSHWQATLNVQISWYRLTDTARQRRYTMHWWSLTTLTTGLVKPGLPWQSNLPHHSPGQRASSEKGMPNWNLDLKR